MVKRTFRDSSLIDEAVREARRIQTPENQHRTYEAHMLMNMFPPSPTPPRLTPDRADLWKRENHKKVDVNFAKLRADKAAFELILREYHS